MVLVGQELETGTIQYTSQDGTTVDAFYSRPAGAGSYPGVIVTMEGMGLMDHHKDIAVRFAGQGYLAIAPDLYTREGTPEPENVLATLFASPAEQWTRPRRRGGATEARRAARHGPRTCYSRRPPSASGCASRASSRRGPRPSPRPPLVPSWPRS